MEYTLIGGVFLIAIVLLILSAVLIKRGKRWMLGGRIIKSYEGSAITRRGMVKSKMKVHVVQTRLPRARHIGMELRQATGLGMQLVPVTLSVAEAKELADMLTQALTYYAESESEAGTEDRPEELSNAD